MPTSVFYGPLLKIERADHHIGQLESIFRSFIRDNMSRLRPQRNNRALKRARPRTFPKHTPTVLGDAVHNLHAALDHAYHIVCEANGCVFSEWRRFPFGKCRQSLEGSIKGHKQKGLAPSDKVIAAILDEIQPYSGGKLGLYGLHDLDITDKHLVLIPTAATMTINQLDILDSAGAKTGYSFEGFTLRVDEPEKGGEFTDLGAGGAILKGDPKDAVKIVFQRGQPYEGDSILDTMRCLRNATLAAIEILRAAI
jgi:hypothetical protein